MEQPEPVARPDTGQPPRARGGWMPVEVLLVLALSLGASAVYSAVSLVAKLTANRSLASQSAVLNGSRAPGRPWLDLTYQLLDIAFAVVPALLAVYLVDRNPGGARTLLGLDLSRPRRDLAVAAGLAAVIGIPGLGLYLGAHAIGLNANVVPAALPHAWWAVPVLILSAARNGILEEFVVVGYLTTRLRQGGVSAAAAIAVSAVLRGSYHLYQGFGGFLGNMIMGVVFAWLYQRTRRLWPLVIAHTILDTVAFVGYAALGGRLGLS